MKDNRLYGEPIRHFRREKEAKKYYYFGVLEDFTCFMCNTWHNYGGDTNSLSPRNRRFVDTEIGRYLMVCDTVKYKNDVVVIPEHHDSCRALFETNPMVYLEDGQKLSRNST